jgi:carbamoyltransferase
MIVLGLQFGHDGSACVLKDGRILSYVYGERYRRIKHVIGITTEEIDLALREAGVAIEEIDCCAIVSTQNVELLTGLIDRFSIHFKEHDGHAAPSPLARLLKERAIPVTGRLKFTLRDVLHKADRNSLQYMAYCKMCPELAGVGRGEIETIGWLDDYVNTGQWAKGATLDEVSRCNAAPLMQEEAVKYGFHYPVTVTFRDRSMPAYFVHHHVAHAASCFYRSPFEESAILTHDGFGNGVGYHSGLILYGRGAELFVLGPHHLAIGALYDSVSLTLNLVSGGLDGAGKLMGLAPYGKPLDARQERPHDRSDQCRSCGEHADAV